MQNPGLGSDTSVSGALGADVVTQKLDTAASKAHETIDRVHRTATQVTGRVATDGERMVAQGCSWIAAHPIKAVAGALLAGYLFGRIRS